MQVKIEPSWSSVLEAEFEKDYFKSLTDCDQKASVEEFFTQLVLTTLKA